MEASLRRVTRLNLICIPLDFLLNLLYIAIREKLLQPLLFSGDRSIWYSKVKDVVGGISVYASIVVLAVLVAFAVIAIRASIHSHKAHFEPPERLRNSCILSGVLSVLWLFLLPFYCRYFLFSLS